MNNILRNAAVPILLFAAVSLLTHNLTGAAASTTSTAPARLYYLTNKAFNGNQALNACRSGYHFASFAEISNPAVITYNKTYGRHAPDDGAGPPTLTAGLGWVRTGYMSNSDSSGEFTPTNCNLWTSANSTDSGEVGFFDPSAGGGNVTPVVAFANSLACDNSNGDNIGVWCVED